jgi:hypothetical protein
VPIEDLDDPSIASPDLVILLDGPIGAYDTPPLALLSKEFALLERRLASGRPTLRICLGSPLTASALIGPEYSQATQRNRLGTRHTSCLPIGLRAPGGLLQAPSTKTRRFARGPQALALQFTFRPIRPRWSGGILGPRRNSPRLAFLLPTSGPQPHRERTGLRKQARRIFAERLGQIVQFDDRAAATRTGSAR